MNGAFYIGAIGLDAQQQALDVIANNVANVNTAAFKRQTVQFSSLVTSVHDTEDDTQLSSPMVSPAGVMVSGTPRDWTQGTLAQTGQPLDLAIQGDGFLPVLGPSGQTMLWRGGTLQVNAQGYLAASNGNTLQAMISVPQGAQSLAISATGAVTAQVDGQSRELGKLDITTVKDPSGLVDEGGGYYELADTSDSTAVTPGADGSGTFVQGALETSNVQLTDEMVNVLLAQRAYGASAQVVQAGDQLMSIVNSLRR